MHVSPPSLCLSISLSVSFFVPLVFCSPNKPPPLKVLIHSRNLPCSTPSLFLFLSLLLWACDSWRCPLIQILPDSDTQQLDVVWLPLVPSKRGDNAWDRHRRGERAWACSWPPVRARGNVLCQQCCCETQSMFSVCGYGWGGVGEWDWEKTWQQYESKMAAFAACHLDLNVADLSHLTIPPCVTRESGSCIVWPNR